MDAAAVATAAQTPSRSTEWFARALERTPRQIPRVLTHNAHTALSRAERPIGSGLAPEDATREARLGEGLESPLCDTDRGGETACYAHLVCPECGAVLDGAAHASGCSGKA
jgi:hypothetical protein